MQKCLYPYIYKSGKRWKMLSNDLPKSALPESPFSFSFGRMRLIPWQFIIWEVPCVWKKVPIQAQQQHIHTQFPDILGDANTGSDWPVVNECSAKRRKLERLCEETPSVFSACVRAVTPASAPCWTANQKRCWCVSRQATPLQPKAVTINYENKMVQACSGTDTESLSSLSCVNRNY